MLKPLPFKTVLTSRTVSKGWNTIPLDVEFKRLRPTMIIEFLEHVHQMFEPTLWSSHDDWHCADGFLLGVLRGETYMMRPSDMYLKLIEIPWDTEVYNEEGGLVGYAVNIVVDGTTKDYTIFWARRNCREGGFIVGTKPSCKLFKYESMVGVWAPCSPHIEPPEAILGGAVIHEGRYMVLVVHHALEALSLDPNTQKWNPMNLTEAAQALKITTSMSSLFQYRGKTLLMLSSDKGSFLWHYEGVQMGWKLTDEIPVILCFKKTSPAHAKGVLEACVPPHIFGSLLFFECHQLKYNLETKQMEAMSTGEIDMMLRSFRPHYFKALEEIQGRFEPLYIDEMRALLRRLLKPLN